MEIGCWEKLPFGGSGSSLLREAYSQGADVLVTGDVKYHEAREAETLGVALVDLGHFASELPMVEGLVSRLESELCARGFVAELMDCAQVYVIILVTIIAEV
jgi:putative NIF3 family GTP cyclohydrolase 1 type 2